jgi:sec-independent protein translocase protein TatA
MGMSFSHMALLLAIVLVIFGAGKLPRVMGDLAKGIKAFKNGMHDADGTEINDNAAKLPHDKDRVA